MIFLCLLYGNPCKMNQISAKVQINNRLHYMHMYTYEAYKKLPVDAWVVIHSQLIDMCEWAYGIIFSWVYMEKNLYQPLLQTDIVGTVHFETTLERCLKDRLNRALEESTCRERLKNCFREGFRIFSAFPQKALSRCLWENLSMRTFWQWCTQARCLNVGWYCSYYNHHYYYHQGF